jgi:hypothetical protein
MSASARERWTDDDLITLRKLAGQGIHRDLIAETLGVTPDAVQSMMSRTGSAARAITAIQKERILELHNRGWRPSRIKLNVDASEDTIAMFLRSKGFDVFSKNVTADAPIKMITHGIAKAPA